MAMQASRASSTAVSNTEDGTGDALDAKINFTPTMYHTNAAVVGAWGGFSCSRAVRTPPGWAKETHRAKEIDFHFLDSTTSPEGEKMPLFPSEPITPAMNCAGPQQEQTETG